MKSIQFLRISLVLCLCALLTAATTLHVNTEDLSSKGISLIESQLLNPIRKKLGFKADKNLFSRCPSGIRFHVSAKPTESDPYFYGSITENVGCRSREVCYFKINRPETELRASMVPNPASWILPEQVVDQVEKSGEPAL